MKRPPKIAEWILSRIVEKDEREFILGDLKEFYFQRLKTYGYLKSVLWYWFQIVKSFHLFISNSIFWSFTMFKNYLKTAFRNAVKQKAYTFINIAGLSIGIAACILILVYIQFEMSYDNYHEKADRIYILKIDGNFSGNDFISLASAAPAAPAIKKDFPEVAETVRFGFMPKVPVKYNNKYFYEESIMYADVSVFDIFSFNMIKGDPETALKSPYSVVITEEMAKKYFGEEDPMGKSLNFNTKDDFLVTGIIKNVPQNTLFRFDMLCSFQTLYAQDYPYLKEWISHNYLTYLLMPENYNHRELEKKFPAFIETYAGKELRGMGASMKYFLQNIKDIRLHTSLRRGEPGAIVFIFMFSIIAVLVLVIGCINYMNLATARSATRAREVGMRKVLGAEKGKLIKQFLGESFIYSFISLIIAVVIAHIALPFISSLSGVEIGLNYVTMPWLIPGLIFIMLFVGLLGGSYPAFFLASFKPVKVFQGFQKAGKTNSFLRNILVVTQFTISITLIIGTGVIMKQFSFMKTKDLGFNKENIVVLPVKDNNLRQSLESIKEDLKNYPGILNIAASSAIPGENAPSNAKVPEGYSENQTQLMGEINVDHDFLPTLGIEFTMGRNFSPQYASDKTEAIIINETAARKFGWKNPIGKTIKYVTDLSPVAWESKQVIGVVKDFHFAPLYLEIQPFYISNSSNISFYDYNYLLVKINPENISGTLSFLKNKWKDIDPNRPFDYFFLDESIEERYSITDRIRDIFSYFTLFAVFIACLGLFGLSAFTADQRIKEIGIRKVHGASTLDIFLLFNKGLLKLVIVANVIAWPLAYLIFNYLIQVLPYRAGISIMTFVLSSLLVLIIGLTTISYQSIKTSVANPVNSLRTE
ncbi:ABC transporter permease [candidate division KSB1 bacterium]